MDKMLKNIVIVILLAMLHGCASDSADSDRERERALKNHERLQERYKLDEMRQQMLKVQVVR